MLWKEQYQSICDAPVEAVERSELKISHPAGKFYEYWKSLADGETPDRSLFSPTGAPLILKWFMLFQRKIVDDKERFYLYLQGTAAAELTHGLLQGKYLDEFTAGNCLKSRLELFQTVLRTGQPDFASINCGMHDSEFTVSVDVGAFPFFSETKEQEVFIVVAPRAPEAWLRF